MPDFVRDWFKRKLADGVSKLRAFITVTHEINRITGPRSIYAKVTLSIFPHDSFAFESKVQWPEENYDRFVLDGILDGVFGWDLKPPLAARFVLQEVGWHSVNSAPIAYYQVSKTIVRSVLMQNADQEA